MRPIKPLTHGTPYAYLRGCKCVECLAGWSKHHTELRIRNARKKSIRVDIVTSADRKRGITTIEEKRAAQKAKENSND